MNQAPSAWVEISRSALLGNARLFKRLIGPQRRLMAVIKSNAYGHGLSACARILGDNVDWFGVVNLDEALALRRLGVRRPILVLSYYQPDQIVQAAPQQVELVIGTVEQLKSVVRIARHLKNHLNIHLKCDVGTSRMGFLADDLHLAAKLVLEQPKLRLNGIFSHLADSENRDQIFTNGQNNRFNQLSRAIESLVGHPLVKHLACTAAALVNQPSRHDLVRVGLGLYGLWPSQSTRTLAPFVFRKSLRPVLGWKTRLISLKRLPAGSTVGYGRTRKLNRSSKIGVMPVGYYEGYPRSLSNLSQALIRNKYAPVIGRICMNMTMLDLSGIPKAVVNDEIVLIGRQGRGEVTADALASICQTINYELVARINPNLPRVVVD